VTRSHSLAVLGFLLFAVLAAVGVQLGNAHEDSARAAALLEVLAPTLAHA
jgi:hypothetical protein